jgi:putative membrane protein
VSFLDASARAGFAQAVSAIESVSAVEVVVAVRRRSASYLHANVAIGAVVALASLGVMLFGATIFSLTSILVDPFLVGGIAGALVELVPGLKRGLAPPAMRDRAVRVAARAAFVERGVDETRDRSGLLIYASLLERRVVVIADRGLARKFAADAQRAAEQAMTAALPQGGAAVARELAQLAGAFAVAMPRRPDDINELPDAIDSDLERADRQQQQPRRATPRPSRAGRTTRSGRQRGPRQ